jgi:transcriptional pleiotropic regulator of transition state genes
MKENNGVIRKIDELGRIVLPIHIRRALDLDAGKDLEIFFDNKQIIMKKPGVSCAVCGSTKSLIRVEENHLCQDCTEKAYRLIKK